jgi:hypothetical protein
MKRLSRRRSNHPWRAAVACLVSLLAAASAHAGGGPENVFLVVNSRGDKSKEVANHYIKLRRVPPMNVLYLPLPPSANVIKGNEFRDKLLQPTLAAIERRGLTDQVDQIVYSCEFPWQINFATSFPAATVPQLRPMVSLTAATYFYMFVQENDPSFLNLEANYYFAAPVQGVTHSQAFRRSYAWAPGGRRVEAGGLQYMLATQLGSTSPSGNTPQEIIAYLTRAAGADGTRPPGTFYYMRNNDVRSTARHDGFAAAVDELRGLGFKAEVGNGVVPSGQLQVAGLTTGSAQVPFRTSGSALVPGALVDNLTSQGAVLSRITSPTPQTRVSEYLRLGAAGASGTVVEPFAIAAKFPAPSLHVHYARGSSMAEAFYQSVAGPFQLLIVGDPLCQPWAAIPAVTVAGVADGDIISGTVELTPGARMSGAAAVDHFELFVDGRRRDRCRPGVWFDLDTTKLSDGYHELRVVAVDDSPLQTQGRWIGVVTVKNGRDALSVTTAGGPRVRGGQLALVVNSTVDGETVVMHNGRELGRVTGRQARLQVATAQLGKGPVVIEAWRRSAPRLTSPPLRLEIE